MKKMKLVLLFLAIFSSSLYSSVNLTDGTVMGKTNTGVCEVGYKLVYSFQISHPSGSITSSRNKVNVVQSCQKDKDIKILQTNNLGSFSNKPNEYTTYYSEENRPFNGYSPYSYYSQTKYNGRHEKYMYASDSKVELIAKIKNDIDNNKCQRWAENFSGGNLNRDDNFWTYFCPKENLISHLNSIFPTDNSGVNLSNGLVAHYEFEGNAKDSSGNGNNGIEHGGVGYVDGVIGKAGSFDGVDDYIEVKTNHFKNNIFSFIPSYKATK